eukprot:4786902-Prymnesium_polylepis.4
MRMSLLCRGPCRMPVPRCVRRPLPLCGTGRMRSSLRREALYPACLRVRCCSRAACKIIWRHGRVRSAVCRSPGGPVMNTSVSVRANWSPCSQVIRGRVVLPNYIAFRCHKGKSPPRRPQPEANWFWRFQTV